MREFPATTNAGAIRVGLLAGCFVVPPVDNVREKVEAAAREGVVLEIGLGGIPGVDEVPAGALVPGVPPISSVAGVPDTGVGAARTTVPAYESWQKPQLEAECKRLGFKGKGGLRYGHLPDDVLKGLSTATRKQIADALTARAAWREQYDQAPEWSTTPVGITPPPKKGKPRAAPTVKRPTSKASAMVRLACLLQDEHLFQSYASSRNEPSRGEQDSRETGANHRFYHLAAAAMVDSAWTDCNGNVISLPDNHQEDAACPDNLKSQLRDMDLTSCAETLLEAVPTGDDGQRDFTELRKKIFQWMKDLKKEHTEMRHRESISGGAGADSVEGSDGEDEFKSSVHTWNFCGGRIPTIVYEDLMKAKTGGSCGSGIADAVIADGFVGAGTSVPGGTGTRSVTQNSAPAGANGENGAQGASGVRRRRKTEADGKLAAWASVKTLMSTMTEGAKADNVGTESEGMEELAENVERLSKRLRELPPNANEVSKETFEDLLEEAIEELKAARAKKKARKAARQAMRT